MPTRTVRYAVVGMGHIAQAAVLPAFRHAAKNSRLEALISDDPQKLKTLAKRYHVPLTAHYDQFEECIANVDAVYIALPNSMHAQYAVRAADAGKHVLCEKPLAVTAEECELIVNTCRERNVKLMVAYRLHFEALNLDVVELARKGKLGDLKYFNSSFSMRVRPGNIRTDPAMGGGTLYDIGVYCINAARYLFRDEPTEVVAISGHSGAKVVEDIDETTGALLRFPGGRIASFINSFNAAAVASYRIVGTKGDAHVEPAYEYAEGLAYTLTIGEKKTRKRIGKRDQFAPELLYFSDCILKDREPEPSGEEGTQDVRIVQALYESAETGKPIQIPPFEKRLRPSKEQQIDRPGIEEPALVKVRSSSQD